MLKFVAAPKAGKVFSHWSSLPAGVDAPAPVFSYTMPAADEAARISAVFVSNPFQPIAGQGNTFQGLLKPVSGVGTDLSTLAFLTGSIVPTTGAFSGKLSHNGNVTSFASVFYGNGTGIFTVAGVPTTALTLHGGDKLSLSYTDGAIQALITRAGVETSAGTALRTSHSATNPVPDELLNTLAPVLGVKSSGYYTLALPAQAQTPPKAASSYPQGDGYGTLTLNRAGTFSVVGVLADGSAWTTSGSLVSGSQAPFLVYLPPPGKAAVSKGSFSGTLVFDATQAGSDVTGDDLLWTRPAVTQLLSSTAAATQLYTNGWPGGIVVDAVGALYNKARSVQNSLGLIGDKILRSNCVLNFTEGKLASPVQINALNITGSTVVKIPSNNPTFTLVATPDTGAFSGTFQPNWTNKTKTNPTFRGILLQKSPSNGGYGFFLSNRLSDLDPESGRVTLGKP